MFEKGLITVTILEQMSDRTNTLCRYLELNNDTLTVIDLAKSSDAQEFDCLLWVLQHIKSFSVNCNSSQIHVSWSIFNQYLTISMS